MVLQKCRRWKQPGTGNSMSINFKVIYKRQYIIKGHNFTTGNLISIKHFILNSLNEKEHKDNCFFKIILSRNF